MAKTDKAASEAVVDNDTGAEVTALSRHVTDIVSLKSLKSGILTKVADMSKLAEKEFDIQEEPELFQFDKDGVQMRGVYLGTEQSGKYLQHFFAIPDKDAPGGSKQVLVNSTHQITAEKARKNWEPGKTVLLIKRVGQVQTSGGRRVTKYGFGYLTA